MPYKLSANGLCVENSDTGETVKCHDTHGQAVAHLQALMANVPEAQKAEDPGKPSDWLVVEDPQTPSSWHLRVKRNGTPDHGLMGAAWAALHGGYRGNVYEGPGKQEAIAKLKKLYAAEGMDTPAKSVITKSVMMCAELCRACVSACVECMKACMASPNADTLEVKACMDACHHCIAVCELCASVCETGNINEIETACKDCMQACMDCNKACLACAVYPDLKEACSYCAELCDRCAQECQQVIGETEMSMKIGARNNRRDQERLQMMHDYSVENGAICKGGKALAPDDIAVFFGSPVKALGNGKVAGYLVRYTNENDRDLTGDYFAPDTDYGDATKTAVLYQHGLDVKMKRRKLGEGDLTRDDVGVWVEAQLNLRDEYEKAIYGLAQQGKLGWSSGTAGHLVERDGNGKILAWPLGLDASLTPTPAEYRNTVVTLKSLITSEATLNDKDGQKQSKTKETDMEKEELKALFEENNKALVAIIEEKAETAATKAVDKVLDKLPEIKAKMGAQVQVTVDEADRPFKNLGENLVAIAKYTQKGISHPRIKGLQALEMKAALGSNEAVPSQGEFLLEPTITQTLLQNIHDVGAFSKDAQQLPVGPNSNSGWIPGVDETSRATGSRWGGVRGYHAAEAGSMTASKPKFRRINWELHKIYVLQYATDELLNDVVMLNAIIQKSSAEELDWTFNNDLVNGIGGDRPVGVLQSGALISISRAATSAIAHADIVAMWARMLPRSKANAKWYISSDVHAQLDQLTFTSGSTGILSPYIGYRPDGTMTIYGKPVEETEFNPALGTAGDILLADMSQYLTWEKNAIEAASSIHVQFLTDETAFRFIYRADGQTALASAITPANGGATQSPFVVLLATT